MNISLPPSLTGRTDIILPKAYTSGFTFYPDPKDVEKYQNMDEAQIIEECSNYHISAILVHELWRTGRNQALFNIFKAGAELDTKEFVSINLAMMVATKAEFLDESFSFVDDVQTDLYRVKMGKTYEEQLTPEEKEEVEAEVLEVLSLVGQKINGIE